VDGEQDEVGTLEVQAPFLVEKKAEIEKKPLKLNWKTNNGDWYSNQPKSSFVLQLFAASKRESIDMMIATLTDQSDRFSTFVQVRNGSPVYVLTEGLYSNRIEAEQAAEKFKPAIIPWVRSIESISSVMRTLVTTVPTQIDADGIINDDAWVWSQDPASITIQIAASSDKAALERLVKKYKIPSPLAIMKTSRDKKAWFILVSGLYKNRKSARADITELPQALINMGPWIRSYASIHDELAL
jgi:septal ring-binding cell division protein DamX